MKIFAPVVGHRIVREKAQVLVVNAPTIGVGWK
jgi:hypothetical protein